ncbi:FAD-dependent oxidoreductase [Chamaesiphon sp.]|uniref:FAD-dependent oxidoreductase n=1 Tax=Chamaesiphon sp. TaxID=2814140 RepID=UPI00359380A3
MNQVVIIGAGPTGLTLAMLLAQRGIPVALVEASRNFRRTFRGEALMPSGLEAIEQMGLTDLVAQIPHCPLDAWEFIVEQRAIFRVDEPMEPGGQPCTLISQSPFLEGVLAEASKYPNFEFVAGTAVRDLVWQDDRVVGVILSDDRQIGADLVIGTDGRNSIVRDKANLTLATAAQSYDILWFKLASSPQFEAENIFYSVLAGDAGFGLFLGSEGQLQVGWTLHQEGRESKQWQQEDWGAKLAAASPEWLAAVFQQQADAIDRPFLLSVTVGRCPSWHAPGVLLLGDAAHPMSPIRAQGINMALRDAIVAANYLVPVLQQSLTGIDAILPQIQAEREPEIIEIQRLQRAEIAQGELLRNYPPLRYLLSRVVPHIPLLQQRIRQSWIDRQLQLRRGFTQVTLKV